MKVHRASGYCLALAVLVVPATVHAQGFGVNEIGTCAMSRGYTGTGAPCSDASVIYWNPAAATMLPGNSVSLGTALIQVNGSYTQDTTFRKYDTDIPTAVVPNVFLNHSFGNKWALGIGAYVPYGLTSQWGADFPGRFSAQKAQIQTLYVQPNISWQLNDRWSIGGGPVIGHSSVELIQGLDLSQQVAAVNPGPPPTPIYFSQLGIPSRTEFGQAKLKGSANAYGVHVGVMGKLNKDWTFGARFLSSLVFSYDNADATFTQVNTGIVLPPGNPISVSKGDNTNPLQVDTLVAPQFQSGGALVAQKVATRIAHPAQAEVGFGYTGVANWLFAVDYLWLGWKQFTDLPVKFAGPASAASRTLIEDYNNSSVIRLGAERSFQGGAKVRFGFSGGASAAPSETVTPLLPEQDRSTVTVGASVPLMLGIHLEGAYGRVMTNGRRGRIDERTSTAQTADMLNSGVYKLNANLFSVTLKASF